MALKQEKSCSDADRNAMAHGRGEESFLWFFVDFFSRWPPAVGVRKKDEETPRNGGAKRNRGFPT
jgi:hypothetical protein